MVHGRLRKTVKVKVPKNTIGCVTGVKDKRVLVKLKVDVEGKIKELTYSFKAEGLEVQKDSHTWH